MLQDGFRDDGIKGSVPEWQEVPIRNNIDIRCAVDVKGDDVWGAAAIAGTEIQDARLGSESLEQFSDASVPSGGGIWASDEVS